MSPKTDTYRDYAIRETKSYGSAPHWHCDALKLYGYPSKPDLRRAMDQKLDGFTFAAPACRATGAALLLLLLLPAASFAQEPCKINVNSASPAQLVLLIQTGPALAAKIEAARRDPKTGAAVVLDAAKLDAVSGVGTKWLEYNGPHVVYSGPTTCETKLRKPAVMPEGGTDGPKPEAGKDGAQ